MMAYAITGLVFMLLPGTFLGVWNLISISGHRSASAISPAWIQAHGHAQIFGWIGTFILGIGFYSIPKMMSGNVQSGMQRLDCLAALDVGRSVALGQRFLSTILASLAAAFRRA